MSRAPWVARAFLLYLLAGLLWICLGALVLGLPHGIGLLFIGIVCLVFSASGAAWRVRHGYGLLRTLPRAIRTCG
jgi:hypothetical protein